MTKRVWKTHLSYSLDGTFIELHPEYGTAAWIVVDYRRPGKSLGTALTLQQGKGLAERLVDANPKLVRR